MSKRAGHYPRRRANRYAWIALGFAVLAEAAAIAARYEKDSLWIVFGLLVVMAGALWLEHKGVSEAVPYLDGSIGEQKVGHRLSVLEAEGYRILHGLETSKRSDIDHVVVGPSGIFAIETKALNGRAVWRDGQLIVAGRDVTKKIRKAVSHAAFVRERLPRELRGEWIEAVTTLTETIPRGGCRRSGRMWIIPLDDLVGFIRSRSRCLDPDQIDAVVRAMNGV